MERIKFKANVAPFFPGGEGIVIQTEPNLQIINSYKIMGRDLTIGIHTLDKIIGMDEERTLITKSYRTEQFAERFQNLNEFPREMKHLLLKSGYDLPEGAN